MAKEYQYQNDLDAVVEFYTQYLSPWGQRFFLSALANFRHNEKVFHQVITSKYNYQQPEHVDKIVKTTASLGEAINDCDTRYSQVDKGVRGLDLAKTKYYFLQRHIIELADNDDFWNRFLSSVKEKGNLHE